MKPYDSLKYTKAAFINMQFSSYYSSEIIMLIFFFYADRRLRTKIDIYWLKVDIENVWPQAILTAFCIKWLNFTFVLFFLVTSFALSLLPCK